MKLNFKGIMTALSLSLLATSTLNADIIKVQAADHVHTDECKGTHVHTDSCYETYTKTFTGLTNKQQRFEIPVTSHSYEYWQGGNYKGYPAIEFRVTDIQGLTSLDIGVDLEIDTSRVYASGVYEGFWVHLNGNQVSWCSSGSGYHTYERGRYKYSYEEDWQTGEMYEIQTRIGTLYEIKDNKSIAFSNLQIGDTVKISVWGSMVHTSGWNGKPGRAYIRAMDTSGAEAHGSFTVTGRGMVCNGSVTNEEQLCNKVVTNISPKK